MYKALIVILSMSIFLVACSDSPQADETAQELDSSPTAESTLPPQPTATIPTQLTETAELDPVSELETTDSSLPERAGPRIQTTGAVPHVQLNVEPDEAVNAELIRRAFLLPGVVERPTMVSLPGALGMWLAEEVTVANPSAIVAGREFAHIHPDGSLHAPLPFERALKVAETGWGERHPWADERDGWDGFVMLFTPLSMDELETTFQLIVESYNYVTGESVVATDFK